ncbi:1-phosphatidylinositol-3-phosphate 5-kinase FAB1B-like [Phalaenopsis equestris]|uniref:1-phosphatidylinositol-3-phosphate 5-kinase FAB1B-like n=1 Tax=Phalaenopsis equestris TaxID=78828 RepID=UPI0009E4A1AC|nr:1-phosphatidylinositol-3-phosphate 5-kinase FAB1B-like [Phalaenopsis equestris]XP_020578023.1 1-phosphatidylinositol-3-phosphate 5-kinase FAB1B-like [Phalaenopsis equestris]XP_020578024.1 1-phosphatidylinositol-3-phosphate 5-kinase FAB1B-like [Phalaenopsis equestris]
MGLTNRSKTLSELVHMMKSWSPGRSEPAFRDFWMPDDSCRVCYDCDSQFTVFNRRHHCRLCGRIFCAKCTSNFVPVNFDDSRNMQEESERRIRVCNYCFKQWEQDLAASSIAASTSTPVLSHSLSAASLTSTQSSGTASSGATGTGLGQYSPGACPSTKYSSGRSLSPFTHIGPVPDKQDMMMTEGNMDSVAGMGHPPSNDFGYCMNRSDDEEDEYDGCNSESGRHHFQTSADYFHPVNFDEVHRGYCSNGVHPAAEFNDFEEKCTPALGALEKDKTVDELGHDNNCEFNVSTAIYSIESTDKQPVDIENNERLWLPPEPENEEDERESSLVDDDDGEDTLGEWGYLQSSSFGSGECRTRDRSSEEHKKAMKNVVDGHFRALVAQLLQVENLPVGEGPNKDGWLDIITALSWEAATLLKPDTSKGGGMDPGGYVKVKCVACGSRNESKVVKGVVCKKNVAHRRMASRVEKPRLLILGGALEYQRVTNLLSSFDTLLQQEMDHLKMAVAKIDAQHPNVLLVEKSVSRYAQDYLLAKNISLVLNIKRPLLERISRCTGAQIVPSIDHLSSLKLGHCDLFHVDRFVEEHGSAGQNGNKLTKTLMFFEGCRKPLGCTVLLKGANGDELKKVKHVVQYGVFAAYHLALETSFLADEGASLPELPLKSPITVALPDKPSNTNKSISTIPGYVQVASNLIHSSVDMGGHSLERSGQVEQFAERKKAMAVDSSPTCILSELQNISCQPWGAIQESKLGLVDHFDATKLRKNMEIMHCDLVSKISSHNNAENLEKCKITSNDTQEDPRKLFGEQPGANNLATPHLDRSDGDEQALSKEDFSPSSDHQSILVSLTSRCVWKGTVCERAHLFRIKYYGTFDKPLGRFLRDHLFDQGYRCHFCAMPSDAHVHCYTHRQGSLTISVRKLSGFLLPGERDGKIWMWHRCLCCPRIGGFPPTTKRVVMSDAAWGLSFGKFLELSFSNHAAASRVASCGHSLHRDCLRFYGFGRMVACFRYAPIHLHSVFLPPPKLDFGFQHQDWVKKEADDVADKAELLFREALNTLCQFAERKPNKEPLLGNDTDRRCSIVDFEEMLNKEKEEFEKYFHKVVKSGVRKGEPEMDILEINKLRKQLLFLAFLWDQRLLFASGSDKNNHEVLSGMTKSKEKISSIGMLVDLNIAPKLFRGSNSLDSVKYDSVKGAINLLDHNEGSLENTGQTDSNHQLKKIDHGSIHSKECKILPPLSIISNNKLDPPESGVLVHRILSDGHLSAMNDLSGSLHKKWTGEDRSHFSEIRSKLSESSLIDLSSSVGVASSVATLDSSEEQIGTDEIQSTEFTNSFRLERNSRDLSNWIKLPFLNFYNLMNKNLGKFDALRDYSPVHVSSFRELEHQCGARLLLPNGANGTVIPIYDDEPTSIISYALASTDYHFQISDACEKTKDGTDSSAHLSFFDGNVQPIKSVDDASSEVIKTPEVHTLTKTASRNSLVGDPLAFSKSLHARVCFSDDGSLGKVKYTVTCYYAKHFDSLRRICCPSELDFIRSLSRCKKWGAQGGKSNVFFAKSLDDRFIVKQVTKTELESFIKFAPEYFKYLSESIATGSPTCLAKILGIYQVIIKYVKGGKESRMDVLVMENLLFGRNITKVYDLKGSSRSRYNPDCSGNNKVLLDQNLIETMPTSPIFVGNKAKRILERAVWNDTSFLASIDVMDYSLLVGVDEQNHELVLGIIDFMRQYTWDKHLETWVKASGILGGPKNVSPTVISPEQYKKRFRKAMSAYFLVVPDQWSPPSIISSKSHSDLSVANNQASVSLES